ncbi:MAG: DUF1616 domain-containing protein [Chloroflexota bacterium]
MIETRTAVYERTISWAHWIAVWVRGVLSGAKADLAVLGALGLLLFALVLAGSAFNLGPLSIVRVLLGMGFVLLAPGYLLQAALFPRRRDLDGAARVAMSFGLSISFTAPLALALDKASFGVGLLPMSLGIASFGVVCGAVAAFRRGRIPGEESGPPSFDLGLAAWWGGLDTTQRRLLKLGGIALAIAVVAGIAVPFVPRQGDRMTEFYMLGSEGLAQDFPREGTVGQPFQVTVGIANREGVAAEYRLEAVNGELSRVDAGPVRLEAGAKSERVVWIAPVEAGERVRIGLLLYRDGGAAPYRSLRLWIDVKGGGQ